MDCAARCGPGFRLPVGDHPGHRSQHRLRAGAFEEHANDSAYVKREVERAVSKGKPVFPIRVREVLPSQALELFVSSPHWIDAWEPPLEQYLERLVQAISAATYPAGTHAAVLLPTNPSALSYLRARRRPPMVPLAAAVALLLGGTGWYAYRLFDGFNSAASHDDQQIEVGSNVDELPNREPSTGHVVVVQPSTSGSTTEAPEGCPVHLGINLNLPTPFTCTCSAAAAGTEAWVVAGTDVYTDISNLCRAAVHAGAITTKGGPITVVRSEGRPYYVGSSRNGVATADFGSYGASIEFPGTETRSAGPEGCPVHLGINPNLPTPFTCTCSAAAAGTEAWVVAGTDVYTDISNLCRAAVHAGAITTKGGPITVVRSEGRPYYVGSSRNGVATADFGSYGASIGSQELKPGVPDRRVARSTSVSTPTCRRHSPVPAARPLLGPRLGLSPGLTSIRIIPISACRRACGRDHDQRRADHGGAQRGPPVLRRKSRNGVATADFGSYGASIRFK